MPEEGSIAETWIIERLNFYTSISCLLYLESSNGCQCKMKQKSPLSHVDESQVFTYYIFFLSFSGRSEPFLYFNTFLYKHVFESATILDCLVPVRRFPSPSRSIRFGDVSEANGRETFSHGPRDPKRFGREEK